MLPRLKAVLFGEDGGISKAKSWQGGGAFKYCILESYEDTLNNLDVRRTPEQQATLDDLAAQGAARFREQYLLRYLLDVETRGSQSLLNAEAFADPSAYTLKVRLPGSDDAREIAVDLIETFNCLVGLKVRHLHAPESYSAAFERDAQGRLRLAGPIAPNVAGQWWFRAISGDLPGGEQTVVIWRRLTGDLEQDNLVLDAWYAAQDFGSSGIAPAIVYVNGDSNLEAGDTPGAILEVRVIEADFVSRMFDPEGA
jgi:adenine-specific DNA-methyltransferase